MQFRQLEYFVAVAAERHFARAAARCYVSQSSLSASIGKLEAELGVTLINRGRVFEGLTSEGERLVVWARRILAEHDAFKAEVAAMRSGVGGVLRLGTVPSASTTVSLTIDAFCAKHPLATVELTSRLPSSEIYRRIQDYELDAGLAYRPADDVENTEIVPLYQERLMLIGGPAVIPGGDGSHDTPESMAGIPLALCSEVSAGDVVDAALVEWGAAPAAQVSTDSIAALFALVETGKWASIVPESWFHTMPIGGSIRAIPIEHPSATAEVVVAINAAAPGTPTARAFAAVAATLAHDPAFDRRLGGR